MISYQAFALTLSLFAILATSAAALISRRRAQRRRYFATEYRRTRPLLTLMLILAVITLVPAVYLESRDYPIIEHVAMSFIRGIILGLALMFLAHYWFIRETWL